MGIVDILVRDYQILELKGRGNDDNLLDKTTNGFNKIYGDDVKITLFVVEKSQDTSSKSISQENLESDFKSWASELINSGTTTTVDNFEEVSPELIKSLEETYHAEQ